MKYGRITIPAGLFCLAFLFQSGCLGRNNSSGSSAAPKAPSNLTAEATFSSRINLAWEDNSDDETGFIIERKKQGAAEFSYHASVEADTADFADTNLSSGTFYYYRVKAYNNGGGGQFSNEAEAQTMPGPPDKPTLLQTETFSFQQIDLSWQDNSFNEEGFRIERKTTIDGVYGIITSVDADVISFSDTGLMPKTKYYYRLRSYNSLGDSSNSNELSATTHPLPPVAPSALTATAQAETAYQASLQWNDNSDNESGFKIERRVAGSDFQEVSNLAANVTSWIDETVMPGTDYDYRIYGWNAGGYGGYSNIASVLTPAWQPLAPDQLEAWAVSAGQINLHWRDNANNETGFRIERSLTGFGGWTEVATAAENAVIHIDSPLSANTTYYYRIRAYDANGDAYSDYSNIDSAATYPAPTYNPVAPTNPVTGTVYGYEITIQFNDQSDNEEGFIVERRDGESGSFVEIERIEAISATGSPVSYTDTTVSSTSIYYYRIIAYNSFGESEPPAVSSAITTKGPPPNAPSALSATALTYTQIALEWQDNSDNEETFKLERKKSGGSYVQILSLLYDITEYSDNNNIQPDTTYYYRIRSFGQGGYSAYSNETQAETPVGPPAAPRLSRLETVSSSQINIFWSDESNNETGFKIERKTSIGSFEEIGQVAANVTRYADESLDPNTLYYYRLRAYNIYNSPYSGIYSAGTLSLPPNPPDNLTGTAISPIQINLQWSDNSDDESGFALESREDGEADYAQIANLPTNQAWFSHLPVTETGTYYYRVRAWNSIGMSSYSSPVSITTPAASSVTPPAPSNLSGTAVSSYQINLSWDDNSDNEEGFKIRRLDAGGSEFIEIAKVAANLLNFSDTSLSDLTAYTYTVCAYNIAGESAPTEEVSDTTLTSTWVAITPPEKPTARWLQALAYDSERRELVLFGGWEGANRDDTWTYNGLNWSWEYSTNKPPGRQGHAMVYDETRKKILLFGGKDLNAKNDTWEWNGSDWTELSPDTRPPAREGHSLVYDAASQRIILFGGVNSGTYLNDTWEWNGSNWTAKNPANKPPSRTGHAMAYDSKRQKTMLFAGRDTTIKNDIWEWNGSDWTELNPETRPPNRAYAQITYDQLRDKMILFGGQGGSGYLDDTWEWNGSNWSEKTPLAKPPARYWHSMAYDSFRRRIIIFGGWNGARMNDTWEYP